MKQVVVLFFSLFFIINTFSQEKIVSELKVQGNKKLKTSFVKSISTIKSGIVLDSIIIGQDIIRLKRLPSVSNADYQIFRSNDNQYKVIYNIEENLTIIPVVNIYTTNNDEFAYRIGLYEYDLFGRNITFGGFYQKDIYSSYAINFRAPNMFGSKLGLAINYQDLTTQEPVFFDASSANYKYNNESFEVLGLYELNFKNRLELGLNFFTEDYKYVSGNLSAEAPQELKVDKVLYKLIYEYNKLDYHYYFVSGIRNQFNFQYVASRSNDLPKFLIGWNDFLYFKRIGKKGNLANRLRVGFSTNDKTPFAPFALDNNINIRGVGNTIDRGTASIVLNSEYRQTLIEKKWFVLQGNAFVDSGTWRNPGGDLSEFTDSNNIKVYSGLGIRLMHKKIFNAIFRIDYGVGLTTDTTSGLVFGIGQYF